MTFGLNRAVDLVHQHEDGRQRRTRLQDAPNNSVRCRFAPQVKVIRGTRFRDLGINIRAHEFEEEEKYFMGDELNQYFDIIRLSEHTTIERLYILISRAIFARHPVAAPAFPGGREPGEAIGGIRLHLDDTKVPICADTWEAAREAIVKDDAPAIFECWFTILPPALPDCGQERRFRMTPNRLTAERRRRTLPEVFPMPSDSDRFGIKKWLSSIRTRSL